ncbi:MAG: methyltransferase domain-containing protein [Syntrophorhabdaceae bacterium]
MDKIISKLNTFSTIKEKIAYLREQNVIPTPDLVNYLVKTSLKNSVYFKPSIFQFVNFLVEFTSATSVLDTSCENGFLLYNIKAVKNKVGFDPNGDQIELARFLNPAAHFEIRDITKVPLAENEKFDAIVGIKSFSGPSESLIDNLFEQWIKALKPEGHLILIVANNFFNAPAYSHLRQWIVTHYYLKMIASISGLNTGIGWGLMVVKKEEPGDETFFAKFSGDITEIKNDLENHSGDFWVKTSALQDRWDRNFHDPDLIAHEFALNKKNVRKLKKMAQIIRGYAVRPDDQLAEGDYLLLAHRNIQGNSLTCSKRDRYISNPKNKDTNFDRYILREGDILVGLIGNQLKTYVFKVDDPKSVANHNFAIIRTKDNKYIQTYLDSRTGQEVFWKQIRRRQRGSTIPHITVSDLGEILVPVLPAKDLNDIVSLQVKAKKLSETAAVKVLAQILEDLGWDVKLDHRIHDRTVDMALFYENRLQAFIEFRNKKSFSRHTLLNQLLAMKHLVAAVTCFVHSNGVLYEIVDGDLKVLNDFPTPQDVIDRRLFAVSDFANFHCALATANELIADNMLEIELKKYGFQFLMDILTTMQEDIDQIKQTTKRTERKVDEMLNVIKLLQNEFVYLKNAPNELEDKLILFGEELDDKIELLMAENGGQIEKYVNIVKRWMSFYWDKLEELSKQYLPSAEYLFTQLSKLPNCDLSPFILQYCRALENEMLNKIFRAYLSKIREDNIDMEDIFAWDFGKKRNGKPNNENTYNLGKQIKSYLSKDQSEWFFELGRMETILRYLTGNTITKSPLLQHVRSFLFQYFEENIIELEFLKSIKHVTTKYRNKAAHPDIITIDEAKKGQMEIRKLIKQFLAYYKQ